MRRKKGSIPSTPARTPIIRLERASRFYRPDRPALFDISFDLYPGEFIYIVGPSGAGKSTLLKILHASERPDTGTVFFAGCNIADLKRPAIALLRRSIGMIFQDFRLIPDLSVAANISLPLELAGLSGSTIKKTVEAVLDRVGLSGRSADLAAELSGGEQQRVAIARAVVGKPELILADEPTGNLDAFNADFVLDLIEQAAMDGAAVVLATHDRTITAARPHRTIALEKGRVAGASPELQSRRAQEPKEDKRSKDLVLTG